MEETTKIYELRDLKSKDVAPMCNIIRKIGLKEFKSCFTSEEINAMVEGNFDVNRIGFSVAVSVAGVIFDHISDCEADIFKFLSELSGMTTEDIAELDMVVFAEMIIDVFKKEQFKDFMKVVSRLLK